MHVLTVTVQDEFDHEDSATVTVTKAENQAPSTPSIIISPEDAVAGEELKVLFVEESVDPDGDEVFYSYDWYRDGAFMDEYAGSPGIPDDITGRNQIWRVEVMATDGNLNSDKVTAELVIGSDGPLINIQLEPFNATANDEIVCNATVSDPEGNLITEEDRTWLINGTEVGDAFSPLSSG